VNAREVHGAVKLAARGRTVAKVHDETGVVSLDLGRPGRAGRMGNVGADNGHAGDDVQAAVAKQQGQSATLERLLGSTEELSEKLQQRRAAREHGARLARSHKDPVGGLHGHGGGGVGALLPARRNPEVDAPGTLQLPAARVNGADRQHGAVHLK
jgi:hypothetical protein